MNIYDLNTKIIADALAVEYFGVKLANLRESKIIDELRKLKNSDSKEAYIKLRDETAEFVRSRKFYEPDAIRKIVFNSMLVVERVVDNNYIGYVRVKG